MRARADVPGREDAGGKVQQFGGALCASAVIQARQMLGTAPSHRRVVVVVVGDGRGQQLIVTTDKYGW